MHFYFILFLLRLLTWLWNPSIEFKVGMNPPYTCRDVFYRAYNMNVMNTWPLGKWQQTKVRDFHGTTFKFFVVATEELLGTTHRLELFFEQI